MTRPTVLIAGGGVAGLSAAWWLVRAGWRPLLVERARDLRTDGYMLGLSGPGFEVARRMGLLPTLRERERAVETNVFHGRDGRELWRVRYGELLKDLEWVTLARTELVAALYDAVRDDAEIRFGTTVAELHDRGDAVDVRLSDETTHQVSLMIGADGVHSQTRKTLFGDDDRWIEPFGYRVAAFQIADRLAVGRDFQSFVDPGRMVEFYSLDDGRLATLYIWRTDETGPVDDRRAALRSAFADAHPDAVARIDRLGGDDHLFFDTMAMIVLPEWSRGRVALLGDSAHCLTLVSGQGAGMAMASAYLLAQALGTDAHDVASTLSEHEARLRPTIERLQVRSRKMAAWFIPATPRAFAVRNAVMRWLPRPLLARFLRRSIQSELLSAQRGLGLEDGGSATAPPDRTPRGQDPAQAGS